MQILLTVTHPNDLMLQRVESVTRSCADVWPQLDQSTLVFHRGREVAVVSMAGRGAVSRSIKVHEGVAVALDGLAFARGRALGPTDLVHEELGTAGSPVEGVHFIIRAVLDSGETQVVTDPLGMKMAFAAQVGPSWIVANNALVLMRLLGSPRWNLDGVRLLMAFASTGHGRSLIEGIRIIPCGHRWSWSPDQPAPREERFFGMDDLAKVRPVGVTRDEIGAVCDAMQAQIIAAASTGRPLRAPITGGRDSRVLAALVAKAGVECDFFTAAAKGSAEERVAVDVARVLGVRHRVHHPRPTEVVERWSELSRRLLLQNDGYVNVWQIGNAAAQDEADGPRAIVLGGHGGELSRYPYGNVVDFLPGGLSISSIRQWLGSRAIDAYDGLVRSEAVDWTRSYVRRTVDELHQSGWDLRNIAECIAHYERQRTRDASAIRPGYPVRDMLLPYYTRSYTRLSFKASLWDRYLSWVHERMLDIVAPEVRRVPYSQLPKWWHRPLKDVASRANRLLHWDRLRKKKVRTSPQQGWFAAMMPHIRETCMDASSSRLWDVIDRSVFERFTSPAEQDRLAVRADGILRVYSFFEYARLAGIEQPGSSEVLRAA